MLLAAACGQPAGARLTVSGSAVGLEADLLRRQIQRFNDAHPRIAVTLRATPDAADQRHQLYVQWLNARACEPDILQLDVVWTPEFAAAGWIGASIGSARTRPNSSPLRWTRTAGTARLYALPWFVDVGHAVLAYRSDAARAGNLGELASSPQRASAEQQGARSASCGRARATRGS